MISSRSHAEGYTLVELMVTVSIILLLAAVALPKYADSIKRALEGGLKGNLGSLRSAMSLYYSDNSGTFPSCSVGPSSPVFAGSLIPKYMDRIQAVNSGLHPPTNAVYCDYVILPGIVHDGQGWYYDGGIPADPQFGSVWVACDHTDTKGTEWSAY